MKINLLKQNLISHYYIWFNQRNFGFINPQYSKLNNWKKNTVSWLAAQYITFHNKTCFRESFLLTHILSKYLYFFACHIFKFKKLLKHIIIRVSIVVSIPACHAGDRGSIPRHGEFFD